MRRRAVSILIIAGALLLWSSSWSMEPKQSRTPLDERAFSRPELSVSTASVPLREVMSLMPNRQSWAAFLAEHGPQTAAYIDPRSGTASSIILSEPLIPGDGKGNRLTLNEVATAAGRPVAEIDSGVVKDVVRRFILDHRDVLGVDVDQLGEVQATQVTDEHWLINVPQQVEGIPVRFARIGATLSHGNLVLVGTEMWGDVRISTRPRIDAAKAEQIGFDFVGGRQPDDTTWKEPQLSILPMTPPGRESATRPGGRPGDGYAHRLVWAFGFKRESDEGRWEVLIDAQTSEVLGLVDTLYYLKRKIKGGVFPLTNTGFCPSPDRCGMMQPGTPMPFADYTPSSYADSAGAFDYTPATTTHLQGKYITLNDACGVLDDQAVAGDIDLGGTGEQSCVVPPGHSAGDTAASRTTSYHLNKIAEMARGWLPNNTWLQGQPQPLRVNVNVPGTIPLPSQVCNAYWDGTEITTKRGGVVCMASCCQACLPDAQCSVCGPGCCEECCIECRNFGENAGVLTHEWGHGLDANDGSPCMDPPACTDHMSNTSEAYGDVAAMYRTQTSCIGYGLKTTMQGNNQGCGDTEDGTGFNQRDAAHCFTNCSAAREADTAKRSPSTPDTPLSFVCPSCPDSPPGGRPGPCGKEEHCEAAPIDQAAWDFAARDLQMPPFNYSPATAFNLANRLFYLGSGNIQSWHQCDCAGGTANGCNANSGYLSWLAVDDDNGDTSDGTPHMTALYNAFDRHGIACPDPAPVVNSGCGSAPTSAPALTATGGPFQANLSWTTVPGATQYWVFRTEGQAGCDTGRARIAVTASTSYTDPEVADGRQYYYSIMAATNNQSCSGPASSCVCATPSSTTPAQVVASADYQTNPGTIAKNNYTFTQTSNNKYETLQETLSSGVSRLAHTWKFVNVSGGCGLQLTFEGNRPTAHGWDGDDFKFRWAPDVGGVPGTFQDIPGAVINQTSDVAGGTTVPFGDSSTSGTIYIRIEDTSQSSGTSLDKVNVDWIALGPR